MLNSSSFLIKTQNRNVSVEKDVHCDVVEKHVVAQAENNFRFGHDLTKL